VSPRLSGPAVHSDTAWRTAIGRPAPVPAVTLPAPKRVCTGCSGGEESSAAMPGRGSGGIALEPFPRQVLVGNSGGAVVYLGPIYDATHWKSIAWWFEVYAALLGTPGAPATAYLNTAETIEGPWTELIVGGEPGAVGVIDTGVVEDPGRFVRASISVRTGEMAALAFRMVARVR